MVTLKEVAVAANVSTVTASSVLSGVNRVRVAPATAERIHAVAKSMNYVPLAAARGLRTGKTRIISFVAAAHPHPRRDDGWHEALRGVSDFMEEREERLMLVMPRTREDELETVRQMAFGRQVDGFIIKAGDDDAACLELLAQSERPFVMMGGTPRAEVNCVTFDMEKFAAAVIGALGDDCGAALLIMPCNGRNAAYDRFQERFAAWAGASGAICTVWNGASIPAPEWLGQKRREAGGRKLAVVLLRGLLPETIQALAAGGVPAGGKSRVVYVSNGRDVMLPQEGLTVMRFDNYTLGQRAARMLLRMVDGEADRDRTANVVIPATREA